MSLFRIDPNKAFRGPHQNQPVATAGPAAKDTDTAMILVHGRGAGAKSMLLFSDEFRQGQIHYCALQARDNTWYPQSFLAPVEQNQPGINSGLQFIYNQMQSLNEAGIKTSKIMLLGFSQGACLVSEFAARHPQKFGGIVGLSGGLIGPKIKAENYRGSFDNTPVFLGCSNRDPHIPKERVDETEQVFQKLGSNITKKIYKGMGHTVNKNEIMTVQQMIANTLSKN